ncbi:hypothetical protein MRX96_026937 [Rhipicephalus microplus]
MSSDDVMVSSEASPPDAPHSASDDALASERLSGLRGTTLADPSSGRAARTRWLPNRPRPGHVAMCPARRRYIEHRLPSSRLVAHLTLLRARLQADLHEIRALESANWERRIPQNDTSNGRADIIMSKLKY